MPISEHYYVRRPDRQPTEHLPFGVRSTGFVRCVPPHTSIDKKMPSFQLFWCTQGSGLIEINGREKILKYRQIAILFPGMRHFYRAFESAWAFYWMTLDGPLAVVLPSSMRLESAIYDAGPAPAALFLRLRQTIAKPSLRAESDACQTVFEILLRAARLRGMPEDALVQNALALIHQKYSDPELNIKTLAAMQGVPRAKLFARFQTVMGLPPSVYLKRLRVQNALALLQRTALPVSAIAIQCGLADSNYFARLIRQITGVSPTQYRRQRQSSG